MNSQTRIAIVTGGLSGMGRAIARRLAAHGTVVIVGARRGDDPELTADLRAEFGDGIGFGQLDVRETESCARFVDGVLARYGRVDILVNAAGVYEEAAITGHSDRIWDETLDTNLTGTFKMIRAVMPSMAKQKWGRIVNIASVAAHHGMANNAAYCASKAGLLGLGRCVSLEGAALGITCNSISPTWVQTEMLTKFIDDEVAAGAPRAEVIAKYEASNPQGKLVQPDEIAELVAYLVSDAARAVTMEDIQVNAGSLW
ncbi:SDR family NAD(P)-dependent oxidoreductase [Paracoccus aestuariivivens]|uniref:SDR family oxidoreductase n=1 Tax=Paracoccus aestuariivivens TaxID=1820333 RepID=A0A6L6JA73_9RHOB|nr:SDR family oxidoreductase [Paracoccus aestuariivivens]MTH78008.1 SDR family oxidoreductase [Paracoccus aestuariivivens]